MAWTYRAGLGFTNCQQVAIDPVYYDPLNYNRTWCRFERTMKGEEVRPGGHILTPWAEASNRQRSLARSLDRLLDERPFLKVDLFDGIYTRLRARDWQEPEPIGILIAIVTPEPWQTERKPSRNCSIEWLASPQVLSRNDIEARVAAMLDVLSFHRQILEIHTTLIETGEGSLTELAYEIPIAAAPSPL